MEDETTNNIPSAGLDEADGVKEELEVILDPDGDITLLATGETDPSTPPQSFRVDSGTLRRISPVFKAMLFGGWAESKPNDGSQWVVTLPEDDSRALVVILAVSHSNYKHLPDRPVNASQLRGIVTVCDKYKTFDVILPWLPSWVTDAEATRLCYCDGEQIGRTLIAWHTGNEPQLQSEVGILIMRSRIEHNGDSNLDLLTKRVMVDFGPGESVELKDITNHFNFGPDDWNEFVLSHRLSVILKILDFVQDQVSARKDSTVSHCRNQESYESSECDYVFLGTATWPEGGVHSVEQNALATKRLYAMYEIWSNWNNNGGIPDNMTALGLVSVLRRVLSNYEAPHNHKDCSPKTQFEQFIETIHEDAAGEDWLSLTDRERMECALQRVQSPEKAHLECRSCACRNVQDRRLDIDAADLVCYNCYSMGLYL